MTRRKRERNAKAAEAAASPGEITQREGARLVALKHKCTTDIYNYFIERFLNDDPDKGRTALMALAPFERASYILATIDKPSDWRLAENVFISYQGDGWMGDMHYMTIDPRDEEFVVTLLRFMVPSLVFMVSDRLQRLECFEPRKPMDQSLDILQAREHLGRILDDVSAF